MNVIINFIGIDRVERFVKKCFVNIFIRYLILLVFGIFVFVNLMILLLGRFLLEKFKFSYFVVVSFLCYIMNGLFLYINLGELFIYLGIVNGIIILGFLIVDLVVRYLLVGIVVNFIKGVVIDYIIKFVEK